MKYRSLIAQYVGLIFMLVAHAAHASNDSIVEFSVQKTIGYEEIPLVQIEVDISKTRDLHVAIQDTDGWQTVKRTMMRLKDSGKFHFKMPVENFRPGNYRFDAYLTPRGKDWSDRLGETTFAEMQVVDQPQFIQSTQFSQKDKVKFVDFPKQVTGKEDVTLRVLFDLTTQRDLHLKLLNSDNWKEFGALKFTLSTPGDMTLPLSNLTDDFPPGNYAWVIYLTEVGKVEPLVEKYGKHFILKAAQ